MPEANQPLPNVNCLWFNLKCIQFFFFGFLFYEIHSAIKYFLVSVSDARQYKRPTKIQIIRKIIHRTQTILCNENSIYESKQNTEYNFLVKNLQTFFYIGKWCECKMRLKHNIVSIIFPLNTAPDSSNGLCEYFLFSIILIFFFVLFFSILFLLHSMFVCAFFVSSFHFFYCIFVFLFNV